MASSATLHAGHDHFVLGFLGVGVPSPLAVALAFDLPASAAAAMDRFRSFALGLRGLKWCSLIVLVAVWPAPSPDGTGDPDWRGDEPNLDE